MVLDVHRQQVGCSVWRTAAARPNRFDRVHFTSTSIFRFYGTRVASPVTYMKFTCSLPVIAGAALRTQRSSEIVVMVFRVLAEPRSGGEGSVGIPHPMCPPCHTGLFRREALHTVRRTLQSHRVHREERDQGAQGVRLSTCHFISVGRGAVDVRFIVYRSDYNTLTSLVLVASR